MGWAVVEVLVPPAHPPSRLPAPGKKSTDHAALRRNAKHTRQLVQLPPAEGERLGEHPRHERPVQGGEPYHCNGFSPPRSCLASSAPPLPDDVCVREGRRVEGLAHGVQPHVDGQRGAGHARRHIREEEKGGRGHVLGQQRGPQGRVGLGVLDRAHHEGLALAAADRGRGTGRQRARAYRVDADAVRPAGLIGEGPRVGLQLRFRAAHATAVAGDHPLRGDV
mmetsp:Transcript_7756/g.21786  ORF Transcript_7756/g.21786 Transcript_7756/m.21786 type:complete len:222 (+) Transcript_7756:113-778(+)